jgi:hypothetical protein
VLATTALLVVVTLAIDGPGFGRQLALGAAIGLYLALIVRRGSTPASQVVVAMVIATTGEFILALGWGLYDYTFAEIPFYVPPGHGIFYLLAAESARQRDLQRHERLLARMVVAGGSVFAVFCLVVANDVWGFLWWIGAVLFITRSSKPLMMAACVFYTLVMEVVGTTMGNWRWEAVVPGLGVTSANPPSGVGVLYALLDTCTLAVCSSAWFLGLKASKAPWSQPRVLDLGRQQDAA